MFPNECSVEWVTICNNQKKNSNRSQERFLNYGIFSLIFVHIWTCKYFEIKPHWFYFLNRNKWKWYRQNQQEINWCKQNPNRIIWCSNITSKLVIWTTKMKKKYFINQRFWLKSIIDFFYNLFFWSYTQVQFKH